MRCLFRRASQPKTDQPTSVAVCNTSAIYGANECLFTDKSAAPNHLERPVSGASVVALFTAGVWPVPRAGTQKTPPDQSNSAAKVLRLQCCPSFLSPIQLKQTYE